jgi:twitching motility protein PilT
MISVSAETYHPLADLAFTDLFVSYDHNECWYKESSDSFDTRELPKSSHDDVINLRKYLQEQPKDDRDFAVFWGNIRLRVERMDTSEGSVFVCRRYMVSPKGLNTLGFPQGVTDLMLSNKPGQMIKHGLVLFIGRTGSGKSTSAAAYIIERLIKFGGVCWTAEDPIELSLHGRHGKGICYQTEIKNGCFTASIRSILRASPNIILIGEIRDNESAKEALRVATSGHLVVATLHSNDVSSGLARLARMADGTDELADSIQAAFHLDLRTSSQGDVGNNKPKRILHVEPLFMMGESEPGVRSQIREGDFRLIRNEVARQRHKLLTGGLL